MRKIVTLFALLLAVVFYARAYAAPLPNYDVTIADGVFTPEKIEVPAGQRFKITIQNTGSSPAEFENLSMRVEKVLGPGVKSFVVIHPSRAAYSWATNAATKSAPSLAT